MRSRSYRLSAPFALSPLLLAIAALAPAAAGEAPPAPQPEAAGQTPAPEIAPEVAAEALYAEALAKYRAAAFAEALDLVNRAVQTYPPHAGAQKLRGDVLAMLSNRTNRLQLAAQWFGSLQDIRTQETAVRLAALLERGDKAMAAGDYDAAELDYDRVEIGIRSFPYAFDWGDLPKQVADKRAAARDKSRQRELQRQTEDRKAANDMARRQADLQAEALRLKTDELMRRAQVAFERKDYRRAEVEAWNAYELDRRREDARELYLAARREGHYRFDVEYRAERLEGLARVAEEVHKSLIPQNELLVFPEDWQNRAMREAREIGSAKAEQWMEVLSKRFDDRITFDFRDQGFEDVVTYLRQVTGTNIIVSPQVIAAGGKTVTLQVKDMTFRKALDWILEITGLHMSIENQAIYINTEPVLGAASLRLYDIADLVTPARDFPGPEMAYPSSGGGGGGSLFGGAEAGGGEPQAVDPGQLVDFIKNNVTKGAWDPARNIDIQQRSGSTLFVSHTREGHRLIDQLLASLRNQGALQVNVGVSIVDVRKGFFEEIGVEWHNAPQGMITASNQAGYLRAGREHAGQPNEYGYTVGANLYHQLPANTTAAAYGIDTVSWIPGSGTPPKGLMLEGAMNVTNFLNQDQLNAIFSAAEDETDATVLNHPQLTCFNGQRAHAMFINQFAYIQDYNISSANYDPQIQILNYGDILDVRPVVSSDRKYVTMEIRPTNVSLQGVFVENIAGLFIVQTGEANYPPLAVNYPIELPNIQIQTVRSTVMLPDRGSLLIGGFNRSLRQRTHTGLPFLSHIPFLGRLFSRNGTYDESRRIFFLLSATIIDLDEHEQAQ